MKKVFTFLCITAFMVQLPVFASNGALNDKKDKKKDPTKEEKEEENKFGDITKKCKKS